MGVTYHRDLVQGSSDWLEARRGLLTASEMKLVVTPTFKPASNDKERAHLFDLLAQRVVGYVEPGFTGVHMERGHEDEVDAKILYQQNYAPIDDCGFITNDRWGFKIGYSPDGLVNGDPEGPGQIEIKSRLHKLQAQVILEHVRSVTVPADHLIQVQTGLAVSERAWCDYISFSAGLPMVTLRIYPDPKVQEAIIDAARDFELRLAHRLLEFHDIMNSGARLLATERRVEREIHL